MERKREIMRRGKDDLDETLQIRTTSEVKIMFKEFAARFARHHDALVYLLANHYPLPDKFEDAIRERKFL